MDNHSAEDLDVSNSKRVTQCRLPDLTAVPYREIAFRRHHLYVIACFHSVFMSLPRKHVSGRILLKLSILSISTPRNIANI
jgi:hypothetical protein